MAYAAHSVHSEVSPSSFSQILETQGISCGSCCAASLSAVSWVAILIIACMGAAGAFPAPAIGYAAIGLGAGIIGFILIAGSKLKERKIELLIAAAALSPILIFGALGAAGVLSSTQVGWGILATQLCFIPLGCLISCVGICMKLERHGSAGSV